MTSYNRSVIKDRLDALTRLASGWDGYQGAPVREENAKLLMDMLDVIKDDDCLISIVPSSDGGVQIEWHDRKLSIEIFILTEFDIRIDLYRPQSE